MTQNAEQPRNASIDSSTLAAYRALIAGLPITLRPSLNGQLGEWETLFPYERRRVCEFLSGLASFAPAAREALMMPLRNLEKKMGVERWDFSQSSDTMENASLLARSEFYGEWREQIRRIYAAVEQAAGAMAAAPRLHRLVVVLLPASLPFHPDTVWKQWGERGASIHIDGDAASLGELLLKNLPLTAAQDDEASDGLWLIDAESSLKQAAPPSLPASSLSWTLLRPLRDHVLERVNTVPRSIAVTDRTLADIRSEDMSPLWPAELAGQPQLQRFLIDLYLSGNGALIFPNAFVQWAASEAIRRARPRILVARFGLRTRPKPFTGIAIFENQQRVSALADVDDPQGSAIDASILARYIALAVQRFPEGADTALLAVSESAQSAFLSLPASAASTAQGAVRGAPQQIADWLLGFLAAQPVH